MTFSPNSETTIEIEEASLPNIGERINLHNKIRQLAFTIESKNLGREKDSQGYLKSLLAHVKANHRFSHEKTKDAHKHLQILCDHGDINNHRSTQKEVSITLDVYITCLKTEQDLKKLEDFREAANDFFDSEGYLTLTKLKNSTKDVADNSKDINEADKQKFINLRIALHKSCFNNKDPHQQREPSDKDIQIRAALMKTAQDSYKMSEKLERKIDLLDL